MKSVSRQPVAFRLYLISDRRLVRPRELTEVCDAVLTALAREAPDLRPAIQLREKDLESRSLHQLATKLKSICTRYGAPLIVNDRMDVALAASADGVHLAANSVSVTEARRLLGPTHLIGVSTHSADEAAVAAAAGADFAVFGPVWPALSKPGYGPARGVDSLVSACRAATGMPVYALGGVTAERIAFLKRHCDAAGSSCGRLAGIAVIGAVFGADDPAAAALELAHALRRTPLDS